MAERVKASRVPLLFLTVLIIATCGLVYELVAGTVASYLIGDSVTSFSTIIGVYLSAMGLGSYLSRFVQKSLVARFIDIELAVALVGGFSAPLLFVGFAYTDHFRVLLYGLVLVVGTFVGLEIPLLMRILQGELEFKDLVSQVLTFDYAGALLASLLFPLVLMPTLGLVRTSLLFGMLNAGVGLWSIWLLRDQLRRPIGLVVRCLAVLLALLLAFVNANRFTHLIEEELYAGNILYSHSSHYQRILVAQYHGAFQLYLNGNLQFNSADEYRYHEALVHPAFAAHPGAARVLVCGGGDGLALREILKYPSVKEVVLVDLDPAMTDLGRNFPLLVNLNKRSFEDPRVKVVNADAMVWVQEYVGAPFDIAIVDFPDPNNFALGKLYTTRFYHLLKSTLSAAGVAVVQSTSPLFSRQSYWCVTATMESAGFKTAPYHASVPSFGEWGFVLAGATTPRPTGRLPAGLKYLSDESMPELFVFSPDMARMPVEINRLNNQMLVRYYEQEWKGWN